MITTGTSLTALNASFAAWNTTSQLVAGVAGVVYTLSFEPLPRAIYGRAPYGSNAFLDLSASAEPLMIALLSVSWADAADDATVRAAAQEMMGMIERGAAGYNKWLYLNYVAPWQGAVASYGEESVARMWAVSRKYDPRGVFQTEVPGGQKLPV
jgi:hypothetical protein